MTKRPGWSGAFFCGLTACWQGVGRVVGSTSAVRLSVVGGCDRPAAMGWRRAAEVLVKGLAGDVAGIETGQRGVVQLEAAAIGGEVEHAVRSEQARRGQDQLDMVALHLEVVRPASPENR